MLIDSEDVKQAINERLLELFPDIAVYKEAKTKIIYPHFFVYQINVSDTEERKCYHLISHSMEIRYRVASDSTTNPKLEQNLDSMSLKLFQGFDIIDFEDEKMRCEEKRAEKVDGVLHFFFTVNILAKVVSNVETIKQNKLEVVLKNGGQV